jgi:hypothetical protein
LAYSVEKLLKTWSTRFCWGHKPSPERVAFNSGRSMRSNFAAVPTPLRQASFSTVSTRCRQSRLSEADAQKARRSRTTWYRPPARLSGLSTCVVTFKPIRKLLVGGDGIALEAFLQAPLTRGVKTPLRRHQCSRFPFWSFSTENWFYGHTGACRLHSTLRTSRCGHGGHCPRSLTTKLAHSGASPQWPSQKRRRTRWSHRMRAIRSPSQSAKLTCIACHGSGFRALPVSATGAPTGAAARLCATREVAPTRACS